MKRQTSRAFVWTLAIGLMATAAAACQSGDQEASPVPPADKAGAAADKDKATDKAAPGAVADKGAAPFSVEAPKVDLSVGTEAQARLSIKPAPGFKINMDYPWKASVKDKGDLELTSMEFDQSKWKLSKEVATMEIPVKATKAGPGKVEAAVNFSVCNDNKCEVVRDHKVVWEVAAR